MQYSAIYLMQMQAREVNAFMQINARIALDVCEHVLFSSSWSLLFIKPLVHMCVHFNIFQYF